MSGWGTMALLSENSPIGPLIIQRKGLWPLLSLLADHSRWLKPCTPATRCPPCCSSAKQAYCCHRALALTAPLAWNTPPQVSTWLTISLPSDLCSSGNWSTYQWGSTHHPYKLVSPCHSISPLSWLIFLVLLTTIRPIMYLLAYLMSSLSKCVLHEGRSCDLFTALKMPGT